MSFILLLAPFKENQTSSILSYDINFYELYQKGVNGIKGFINKYQEQNSNISEKQLTVTITDKGPEGTPAEN